MGTLEPGVVLADRFSIETAIPFPDARPAYLAVDKEKHTKLLAFGIDLAVAQALRPGVGVAHSHLASIRAIIGFGDVDVLVTEYVQGQTLEAYADETSRLSQVDAVRFTLRLLDGLQALHQAGGVHGFIRPAGIVVESETRARPVLGYAPQTLGQTPYRSPERDESGPPTVADDAWAAAAVLFRMLTGRDPPATGLANEDDLVAVLDDVQLRQALAHALASDAQKRNPHEQRLRRELARWFADHAGDDHRDSRSSIRPPPPLPPHQPSLSGAGPISVGIPPTTPSPGAGGPFSSPTPSGPPSFTASVQQAVQRRSRKTRTIALATGAVVAGLSAAWIVSYVRSRPRVKVVEQPAATSPAAAPSSSNFDLSEVAVTGESEKTGGDPIASCVASHLPKDTFKKAPDMAWLCSETDGRTGSDRLRITIVQSGGGQTTPAMRAYSQLVWYDLGVYAVVRADCCADAKPFELPAPAPGCDSLTTALADLAKAVNASEKYDAELERIGKIARCESGFKRHTLFRKSGPPGPAEEASFRELMKTE